MCVIVNQTKVNFNHTNLLGDIIAIVFEYFLEGFWMGIFLLFKRVCWGGGYICLLT